MIQALQQTESTPQAAVRALAIVSLLGEGPTRNSAMRRFRGEPVLAQTLGRIAQSTAIENTIVVAWDDQCAAIRSACASATIQSLGPRLPTVAMRTTSAALRWSDGWRGGLLGATEFDRGFDAAATLEALQTAQCEAAILINPAAALIEPATLDALIEHLCAQDKQDYAFAAGAPGSGAMVLRQSTLESLARQQRSPGSLLAYHPDRPQHDPLAKAFAAPVSPRVARTLQRVSLDSGRQVTRLSQLSSSNAGDVVLELETSRPLDAMPREVVLELTTRRQTRPAWALASVERPDLALAAARAIFAQLAEADDIRLTLGGVGDPLCHPQFDAIVAAAVDAGIDAIHVETDLLPDDAEQIERLAASSIDIVSFHLPAAVQGTYAELMGVDRMRDVLDGVKRFLTTRAARGGGVPILVPLFVKCERNLGEMELWYDQWIRATGSAVIVGPSDLSGRVPYLGVSEMTPGTRGPCRRLRTRMTIQSDGSVASCEEDVLGEQRCGTSDAVGDAWRTGLTMLRTLHDEKRWDEAVLCRSCRMWDRP